MTMQTERAVLAGGCFWGMQDLIRRQPGVVSTRVGYTGGDVPNATYRNHGTHAEAIEIVYDPARTSFRRMLNSSSRSTTHDAEPPGQRPGPELPLGDLLHRRRAAPRRRGDHRRRRRLRPLAGEGRDRAGAGRAVLGGRAGAPGLPGAPARRIHLPFRPAELGPARPRPRRAGFMRRRGGRQEPSPSPGVPVDGDWRHLVYRGGVSCVTANHSHGASCFSPQAWPPRAPCWAFAAPQARRRPVGGRRPSIPITSRACTPPSGPVEVRLEPVRARQIRGHAQSPAAPPLRVRPGCRVLHRRVHP